ncbi:TraR/DksA C4-type zinc finger protein [Paraburkholderia sp.]|uniref:TraR/DksA C4-type zinc finger protein n=1 Tax=Paraburkholderia sp. TaxID=1926495 RepID=UPI002D2603DF|nr:TraR/DksA C4-type zinc finger protein [Paraburkholderia sp.]HZZ04625.1 TraR/DksA C4-type zinc finger protein [Paraburkholderia sp.]
MDDFDHASVVEEQFRSLAIAAATRPIRPAVANPEEHCANQGCGIKIPKVRRDAMPGCKFCVDCQERHENALKRRFQCR